jgi:hypothetical protein
VPSGLNRLTLDIDHVENAELQILHISNVFREQGSPFLLADSNPTLTRAGESLLAKLERVKMLCELASKHFSL